MATWRAESAEALDQISDVIDEAYFDADDVRYDASARTLHVPFAQEWDWPPLNEHPAFQDAPRTEFLRKTRRYVEERVPFMRGVLCVRHVSSFSADRSAGNARLLVGIYYVAATSKLTVEAANGDLGAIVDKIDVSAELRCDEVALHVSRRRGRRAISDTPLWGWSPDG